MKKLTHILVSLLATYSHASDPSINDFHGKVEGTAGAQTISVETYRDLSNCFAKIEDFIILKAPIKLITQDIFNALYHKKPLYRYNYYIFNSNGKFSIIASNTYDNFFDWQDTSLIKAYKSTETYLLDDNEYFDKPYSLIGATPADLTPLINQDHPAEIYAGRKIQDNNIVWNKLFDIDGKNVDTIKIKDVQYHNYGICRLLTTAVDIVGFY